MKLKSRTFVFAIAIILYSINSDAQEHINSWFKSTLIIPITEKFRADIGLQHRRQNGFENENLFDKNLMSAFGTWLYYRQNKDVTYAVSPFAYFSNYKIIQKENDERVRPSGEYRFSASVELQHELVKKIFIVDRAALEYRVFEGKKENVIRLRNRLAVRYDINARYNMSVGNEIFINMSGTDRQHVFDHYRLFANFSFMPNQNLKYDIGYIHISRLPKNNLDLLYESNFYFNFTYILKKKPKLM